MSREGGADGANVAFERLPPSVHIALIRSKAELRGSCYFELLPGKYRKKCWNEGSVFLSEGTWAYLEPVIQKFVPRYDHYAFVEVSREEWTGIVAEFRALMVATGEEGRMAELPLFILLKDVSEWLEQQLKTHDSITVLGI